MGLVPAAYAEYIIDSRGQIRSLNVLSTLEAGHIEGSAGPGDCSLARSRPRIAKHRWPRWHRRHTMWESHRCPAPESMWRTMLWQTEAAHQSATRRVEARADRRE